MRSCQSRGSSQEKRVTQVGFQWEKKEGRLGERLPQGKWGKGLSFYRGNGRLGFPYK